MKNFNELIGTCKDRECIILGAANSLRIYEDQIRYLINDLSLVTIGVNNMTHLFIPDYHLWVNNGRIKQFNTCIYNTSKLLIGSHILPNNYEKFFEPLNNEKFKVNYTDDFNKPNEPICWNNKKNRVEGYYRIGGNLAIMLAHLMGFEWTYVVGFDGYSSPQKGTQHCYGKGYTDSSDMELEKAKDKQIYYVLKNLKKYGCNFSIITPTIYKELYLGHLIKT